MNRIVLSAFFLAFTLFNLSANNNILIEAESFSNKGGWVVDQQFMDVMGSPYLLAHGLGEPVENAETSFSANSEGSYHYWVRTKDWAPYPKGPGKFQIIINNKTSKTFGSNGDKEWKWYYGGKINLNKGDNNISLKDLTGFEGRCDAIFFSSQKTTPPNDSLTLLKFRKKALGLPDTPENAGEYDFVVIGGGIAGISAAVSASRNGLKVALIQNRPVLGGNNSSEIRVHLMGRLDKNHYPKLGRIVRELDNGDPGNAGPAKAYGDQRKENVVNAEKNIDLYLNFHAYDIEMKDNRINAVYAKHIETSRELRFAAPYFADCTGDGSIGFLAGADYRMGRESKEKTGESMAIDSSDIFTMGMSNLWYAKKREKPSDFPVCPWALQFTDEYYLDMTHADWKWESGFMKNPITDAEEIRDHNFRAVYGNWSYLKNNKPKKYANWELDWLAYIAGKRESRRLLGDLILKEQDIQENKIYPDGFITATWDIDLHFPDPLNSKYFEGEEFISTYKHPEHPPYPIPYRCLYSRNIDNLFMAGRNISVTHVALGMVRVMRTTGMMGEVLGYAVYLCEKHNTTPKNIYSNHLKELKVLLTENMKPCK